MCTNIDLIFHFLLFSFSLFFFSLQTRIEPPFSVRALSLVVQRTKNDGRRFFWIVEKHETSDGESTVNLKKGKENKSTTGVTVA